MCGCSRLLTCASRACYGVYGDVVSQQTCFCQRQQTQLYACGEATWVGKMLAFGYSLAMCLWQTIYIVVGGSCDAEILRHIDYLHFLRDGMLLQEGFRLSVAEAEEYHIDIVERHLRCKLQVCLANQSLMNIAYLIASV